MMKNLFKIAASILATCGVFSSAFADESVVKGLQKGETFNQGNASYTVYPQLQASFNTPASHKIESMSADSATKGTQSKDNVVLKTDNFTIYKIDSAQKKTAHSLSAGSDSSADVSNKVTHNVVLNNETGKFGILTGMIIVKTKETQSGSLPLNTTGFQIKKSYPAQGFYIVEIPQGSSIKSTVNAISANPNVQKAVVEVTENFKVPM